MRKFVPALLLLASCATAPAPVSAPAPAPAQAEQKPAPPTRVTYEVALPTLVKTYYANGDLSSVTTTQYDAQGRLTRQETQNGSGVLVEVRTGKNSGASWRITVANPQGETTGFEDRVYGPGSELLSQTFLGPKEAVQAANEYRYEKDRKVEWLAKTGTGGLQARTVYLYDAQGNNQRTEVYDASGALTNLFLSTYEGDRLVSRRGFDAANNLVEQTQITWKDGRKVKEETTKPLLRTLEYTYGDKNAPTGIVSSVRGKVVERQTLEYQWFTKTKDAL